MSDLKKVYAAEDEPAALSELDTFEEKWGRKYPKIAQFWRSNWPNLSTYFKYPQEVRTLTNIALDMKLWWPTCEALICAIKLYASTGDKYYFDWFMRLDEYAYSHYKDNLYGEWYGYLSYDGKPTSPPCKGNLFKGPFHLPRMLIEVEHQLGCLIEKETAE